MSLSEAILIGLQTAVVGLSIVFSVLLILMLVLKIFEKIFYKEKKTVQPEENKAEKITPVPEQPVSQVAEKEDEEELIAVLTAAIAASLNTSTYNLKIKSYRRISDNTSAWNKAGVKETIESRY